MTLHPIHAGNLKLDGGAMFGVVPKALWQSTNPADANNMIDIATRCLLIEDGNRLTLIDTGMGHKQSDKFYGYYHLWGDYSLDASLKAKGFHRDDITDVFLTHLHFDHCGGAIQWNKNKTGYEPAFKNKQMIPLIKYKDKTIAFMADLLPTAGHLPLPYVMGYDTRPLLTLDEKESFLNMAAAHNFYLFLEHDADNEIITVKKTEKGIRLKNIYTTEDIFN